MYKKPSSPLYANVSGAKFKTEELTAHNEPTYYNTVTTKMPQPSQAIYSNLDFQTKTNSLYSNVSEPSKPPFKSAQYPMYDNLKSLGM